GIRDFHVTGVQTCALPISFFKNQDLRARGKQSARLNNQDPPCFVLSGSPRPASMRSRCTSTSSPTTSPTSAPTASSVRARYSKRSEERRVGKGGRSAGARE